MSAPGPECGVQTRRSVTVIDDKLPISVVLISRDAAGTIPACLESVSFADDIVLVDSGSADETMQIARQFGARIFQREWQGFGRQKQFAVDQARHDWALCLDTDERVSPALAQSIRAVLANPAYKVYAMPRCNRFMGRWLRHGEGYPDWSVRLFHRGFAQWSHDTVHEKVLTTQAVGRLTGDLMHESAEDLVDYLSKQNGYTTTQAEALFSQGRQSSALQTALSPVARFCKFYFFRLGLLDGLPGLVHISIGCFNSFIKYAKLRELQRKRGAA